MNAAQRLRNQAQRLALAAEHEDVGRRDGTSRHQRMDRLRDPRRLLLAQHLVGFVARGRQAVAPQRGFGCFAAHRTRRTWHARQHEDAGLRVARQLGRVRTEAAELAGALRLLEHRVDRLEQLGRVAAGVVARQHGAAERVDDEALRSLEHARLGAAKTVDALFRIADDEQPRRPLPAGATTGTGIGREPGVQRMPLQRAGVLKFVDQHVADARIEPFLNPAGERRVAQQRQPAALQVGHVGQAARAFVVGEPGEQHAREANHAQVFGVRVELAQLGGDRVEFVLDAHQRVDLAELLARRVLLGEQRAPHALEARLRIGLFERKDDAGGGVLCLDAPEAERQCEFSQGRVPRRAEQHLRRVLASALERGRRHAVVEHAGGVGELELDPLVQRRLQPFAQLRAAVARDPLGVVVAQRRIREHCRMETTKNLRAVIVEVFDQVHVLLQTELVQQLERRGAQQLREPRMEGAHLDRPARSQHARVQGRELRCEFTRFAGGHAALDERLDARRIGRTRRAELAQPVVQPLAHLAGRLARERDREDLVRLRTVEQRAQDARNEHPGLAGAGAGFDDDAAARVAGERVERVPCDRSVIGAVRGRMSVESHAASAQ